MRTYDVAVGSAAGLVAGCRAADGGRSVVVLEKAEGVRPRLPRQGATLGSAITRAYAAGRALART